MTKKEWLFITLVITIWICLFPIVVFGDSPTYSIISGCVDVYTNNSNNRTFKMNINSEVRAVWVIAGGTLDNLPGGTRSYFMLFSETPFTYTAPSYSSGACNSSMLNSISYNYDNKTYYYYADNRANANVSNYTAHDIPVIIDSDLTNGNYRDKGLYYTFGEGASAPIDPVNWGLLKNLSFSQRTRGTGYINYRHNLDYIRWDTEQDSNGNLLTDCQVEIRAHTGFWSASSYDDFLGLDKRDLIGLHDTYVDLGTYPASMGEVAVSWERILNDIADQGLTVNGKTFDIPGIIPVEEIVLGDFWTKFGWWYEVRLLPPAVNPMSWQEVYTPMGSSVSDSNTIVNNNNVTNEVINVYEKITELNNQTQITVIYNDNTVTVVNPDSEPEYDTPDDLYSDVLRKILTAILNLPSAISNGVQTIVDNIVELPEILWDQVQELVTPPQTYDGSLAQRFDNEYHAYLAEEQPTIYDFLEGVEALQPYVGGLAPEDQGIHTCIIRWDAVTLDLTMFNAGTVTLIQAGQHNFSDTLLSFIHAFGMTYADYVFYTSAIIYLWLLVFIWRHFIRFLEKD